MSVTGTMATTIGTQNPFRYRGYYYDFESGFYYLNSRYYDPAVGRFLNADTTDVLDVDQDSLIENNLFAYCLNNPVNMHDSSGEVALALAGGGYLASSLTVGGANFWNPVGWVVLGTTALVVGYVGYQACSTKRSSIFTESKSKRGKGRPELKKQGKGQLEKKKQKPGYKQRSGKKPLHSHVLTALAKGLIENINIREKSVICIDYGSAMIGQNILILAMSGIVTECVCDLTKVWTWK